jgi:hypothetical protein
MSGSCWFLASKTAVENCWTGHAINVLDNGGRYDAIIASPD